MGNLWKFWRGPEISQTQASGSILLQRNPAFIARDRELEDLSKYFSKKHHDGPISCVIRGIGGVGKTQTAIEFTHRYKDDYDMMFWVRADEKIELHRTFGAIGRKLRIFDTEDVDRPKVERIQDWLRTTGSCFTLSETPRVLKMLDKKWLLVFDNVPNWNSLAPYLPTHSRASTASIIVTTQVSGEWRLDHVLPLEPFNMQVGSSLLLRQVKPSVVYRNCEADRDNAREISKLVGGLPLWISQASGYINLTGCTLAEYISSHLSSSNLLGGRNMGSNEWTYERAVETTFDITMKELSTEATDLLFVLTFLKSGNIREDLLLREHEDPSLAFLHTRNKARYTSPTLEEVSENAEINRFSSMLGELAVGQLVRRESGETDQPGQQLSVLTIHRSLQEGLLLKLNQDPQRRQLSFERAVSLLREFYPCRSIMEQGEEDMWPRTQQILPHIQNVIKAFDRSHPPMLPVLRFAELLADVGGIEMYDRGFAADARILLRKADELLDNLKEPSMTTLRAEILTILGLCNDTLGISERAESFRVRQRLLTIRKQLLRKIPAANITTEDEKLFFKAEADMACSLQNSNCFQDLKSLCEKCRFKYLDWGNEENFPCEWAKYHNHMASVFLFKGDTKRATESSKTALNLMIKALPNSRLAVNHRFIWANIIFQNDEHLTAIEEQRKVLKLRIEECGESNLLTLQCQLNIGIMLHLSKQNQEAE